MDGQNGKGDTQRPMSISQRQWIENWEAAFKKDLEDQEAQDHTPGTDDNLKSSQGAPAIIAPVKAFEFQAAGQEMPPECGSCNKPHCAECGKFLQNCRCYQSDPINTAPRDIRIQQGVCVGRGVPQLNVNARTRANLQCVHCGTRVGPIQDGKCDACYIV